MAADRSLTTDSARAPLALDLLGANQRLRDTLAMVFHGPAKARCALAQGAHADAVIVNLDGVGAEADWARYREQHPQRPAIVLSLDGAALPGATAVVAKPVRIEQFLAALDAVESQLRAAPAQVEGSDDAALPTVLLPLPTPATASSAPPTELLTCSQAEPLTEVLGDAALSLPGPGPRDDAWLAVCGNAPDCDLDDAAQADARRCTRGTDVLDCLHEALALAHREQTPVEIRLRQAPVVLLDPNHQQAHCLLSDQQWQALCGTALDTAALTAQPSTQVLPSTGLCAIEALLWQSALWTYRGELPADAPLSQRVYLAHWPNLTRLMPLPNACRIAALLVRHPMQLARVAEALGIAQRQVFAFYGAASAIGLMGIARRETDHLLAQEPPLPDSRRALLQGIARRLARDGADAAPRP